MATTKDHEAHRHHLNTHLYVVARLGWDEVHEHSTADDYPGFHATLTEAAQVAHDNAPQHPGDQWEVRRGQWTIDRFTDARYGRVTDAVWEIDDDFYAYGNTTDDGASIEWEVEE